MNRLIAVAVWVGAGSSIVTTPTMAFAFTCHPIPSWMAATQMRTAHHSPLQAQHDSHGDNPNDAIIDSTSWNNMVQAISKIGTTIAMTAFLWGSPAILAQQHQQLPWTTNGPTTPSMAITTILQQYGVANAKEMASGSGSRVNKDAESLLRYGLPINNKEVRV